MTWSGVKRRVFISHYKADRTEVDRFINDFGNIGNIFTPYVLGANSNDDFINSTNTDYVMSQIRQKYLQDTTVTIVLIGGCTHSRRYVDWEIKSSLTQGNQTPNGLIGILLPSQGTSAYLPPRMKDNWNKGNTNCYVDYYSYPQSYAELGQWIDKAYESRSSKKHLIKNSQDMMKYNSKCKICGVNHN